MAKYRWLKGLMIGIVVMGTFFISSCSPSLSLNPKYTYTDFEITLGDKIDSDPAEYVDFSQLSKQSAEFVHKNIEIQLDDKVILKPTAPDTGNHTLTINYCGNQYRKYNITVADREAPVFTKKENIYTFVGLSIEDKLDGMFKAKDNSGSVKIKIDSDNINTFKTGKYSVKAIATDPSGNTAEAIAFVIVEAPDYGAYGTYVYISIPNQTLTYFVDGLAVLHCPIVTGDPWAGYSTPTGIFTLLYKSTNITLKGLESDGSKYEAFVSYWMSFIGDSYGMHDATWRSSFGGSIYQGDGSHGCINMPYESAQSLYQMIAPGTPIIIY